MHADYLIIGNSAGGVSSVEAIRSIDKKGDIFMVSEEPYLSYSRPLIAKVLTGDKTLDEISFRPEGFYEENNVAYLRGKKVVNIDFDKKVAGLDSGESIDWQKLLLATGGKPIVPPIKGADKKGIFTFINYDDAKGIDNYLDKVEKAVVIGGGLIGTSVTDSLCKRGIKISIVEMKDRLLNVMLDEEASQIAEEAIKDAGVEIITNSVVSEILGGDAVSGVKFDNGQEMECQMVIVAIGVSPRTELAQGTKLEVDRGIIVDSHMRTNIKDVYACGDASQAYDFIHNANRLSPIWPNAYMGGRIAGFNMAGKDTEYNGSTAMNSLNYFGLDIVSAGLVNATEDEASEIIKYRNATSYKKIVIDNGIIKGMVCVGEIEPSGIIYGLMKDKINVNDFKDSITKKDFGLAYLPREKRDQYLFPIKG